MLFPWPVHSSGVPFTWGLYHQTLFMITSTDYFFITATHMKGGAERMTAAAHKDGDSNGRTHEENKPLIKNCMLKDSKIHEAKRSSILSLFLNVK